MNQRPVALIDERNCIGCTICIDVCPFDAIIGAQNFSHRVIYDECPGCKICLDKCPTDCIKIIKIDQNKNDIKDKIKYNFDRRKSRKENLQKKQEENINEQLKKIVKY
jgi:electron transport complex protein RnfB